MSTENGGKMKTEENPRSFETPKQPSEATHTEQKETGKFFESNAGDGTTALDHHLKGVRFIVCFLSCFITLFLIGLDQTIVLTILETVAQQFDSHDKIAWVSTSYMLPMAVLSATWGRISILFGRKASLLTAIAIFEVGSLVCALAPNMESLIGGRVISGIGAGGIQTLVFIVVTEIVPINKRPLVLAFLATSFSVSSVTGPVIGGAFTQNVSWRWCFYINIPIGVLAMTALFFCFKPPKPKGNWKANLLELDHIGTLLLTGGVVLILLATTFGDTQFEWKSGAIISMFIIGGVLVILFCIWNFKYSRLPIIPFEVIKVFAVDFAVLSLFTCYYSFMGSSIYLTTYFQVLQGLDALHTGLHLLPMIIAAIISSVSSGVLIKKTRYIKPYAITGSIAGSVGLGTLTLLKANSSSSAQIGLLILPGIANGMVLQAGLMSAQLSAPKTEGGTILTTALFNFSRALGGAIGGSLSQTIFNSSYRIKLDNTVSSNPSLFEGVSPSELSDLFDSPSSYHSLDSVHAQDLIVRAIMGSITNVFIVGASISTLTVILCAFYSNKRIPQRKDIMTKLDMLPDEAGCDEEQKSVPSAEETAIVDLKELAKQRSEEL